METISLLDLTVRLAVVEAKVTLLLAINGAIGLAMIGQVVTSVARHIRNGKNGRLPGGE